MKRQLAPLNSLRAFEASARHLSFTKAAQELNVTPAAISQQVKLLEDYFSVKLFKRLTRALILTPSGKAILPILTAGFDQLSEADQILRNRLADNSLTISVAPGLGAKWLLPRLDLFRSFAPDYEVRIDATEMLVDFNQENVDVAIRYGKGNYPGLESDCLITERIIPVCSPKLQNPEYPLKVPQDLEHYTLLHNTWATENKSPTNWAAWLKAAGVMNAHTIKGIYFNQNALLLEAAIDAQGVALEDAQIAENDLKNGRLIQLFSDNFKQESRFCYYLVYPKSHLNFPKVAAFREWILNEINPVTSKTTGINE